MSDPDRSVGVSIPLLGNASQSLNQQINQVARPKKGLLSRLFFCWVVPILRKSNRTILEVDMVEDLDSENTAEYINERFKAIFSAGNKNDGNLLVKSLLKTYCGTLVLTSICLAIAIGLQMLNPILIHRVIDYIQQENDKKDQNEGIILICVIMGVRFLYALFYNHAICAMRCFGYDCMSSVSMALLSKCMKVSFQSNKQHKTGEVINLVQVDTSRLQMVGYQLAVVIFMPIQIIVALYLMFDYIGVSFTAGVGVIIITGMLNMYIGKKTWVYQRLLMKAKDERTKQANELFSSIKFVKVNAFEDYFITKLLRLREKEMTILRSRFLIGCFNILLLWLSPMLIINVTFGMYVLLGNTLTAANTFTLISLFQILQEPLRSLPQAINALIEANVSMKRMQKFLLTDEVMMDCIEYTESQNAISVKNGEFYWNQKGQQAIDKAEDAKKAGPTPNQVEPTVTITDQPYVPTIKDIQIQVLKGQFIAIVGDVGSGKSSLLQSLIGEMIYDKDEVKIPQLNISGSIAYVSQKAWIQNATVKDNIIFGRPYVEEEYRRAVKYSCLAQDIEILIKGDQTMIGEKGINLSGGQKARISLARAIYSDSDIYLLDDPISAVDVHVGKFIIHQCLKGILKQKTRVLVTHALNYCQHTDVIYLMEDGRIAEQGSYEEMQKSERFQRVYEIFYKQKKDEKGQEDEEFEEDELPTKEQLVLLKKQSSMKESFNIEIEKKKREEEAKSKEKKDEIDNLMMIEDRQKGGITSDTLITYFKMNGGIVFFIFISLITAMQTASQIIANIWLAYWTDLSSHDTDNTLDNMYYLEIFSSFSLSYGFLAFIRSYLLCWACTVSANSLHRKMVHCLSYAPQCQFFERVPLGRILNRFTKDQSVLDLDIYWAVGWIYIQLFNLLGNTFLNVYASSPYILIPVVLFFVSAWWLQRFYMSAQRELYRLESITKSPVLSFFSECVLGLTTIRAFKREELFMENHAKNLNVNRKIQLQLVYTNVWFQLMLTFLSYIVNISAIAFCIFYSTKNPAFAGLLMTYASAINDNIQWTIQASGFVETQIISFERCLAYTKVKPEKAYEQLVNSRLQRIEYSEKSKYIDNWPVEGVIEYKNYSVQYRENLPPALKNLSLTIEARAKVGVVGRTGAGKSTITLTLLRILEAMQGQILIDGVDISTLSLQQLRESITMIMQDATLFEGSLRQNIDPLEQHTEDQIREVIGKCKLNSLLERDQGLDTKISESGENLSAGEKQLICIARAVLKKSPIVLIDEATANIDIETEKQIQETIQEGFSDCTVITIAHRINTILHCDKQCTVFYPRILVVDRGELKEYGYTKDLLNKKDSLFYGIYLEALREQQKQ